MKIYVAGRMFEAEAVRRIYSLLKAKGHEISSDWTGHKNIKPYDKNQNTAREYAIEDMDGVLACDVFILLTSEETGSGSAGELGAAILSNVKLGKPKIFIVGNHIGNNFFYFHPSVERRQNIEQVLAEL